MAEAKLPPLQAATKWETSKLAFDKENPRFTPDMNIDGGDDIDIIRELNTHADLGELVQSIAASGYVDIEPLVVWQDPKRRRLIVLEGNRRLAAIRLLTESSLAAELNIATPEVTNDVRATLQKVLVYRVGNREEARDFIGFKHINGAHRWDSFAKAKFAANWYLQAKPKIPLRDIARRMGDRHQFVRRLVAGYLVLMQAIEGRLFDVADRYNTVGVFAFSHLYTALTRPGYREFLGLGDDWLESDPEPSPIPKSRRKELKELLLWLYGSKSDDIAPIIRSQNPHLKQLGEVLAVPRARAMMIANADLTAAYALVETSIVVFERHLTDAHISLSQAQQKLEAYDGDASLLEIANQAKDKAILIADVMGRKRSSKKQR